jgi:hypothetical protein
VVLGEDVADAVVAAGVVHVRVEVEAVRGVRGQDGLRRVEGDLGGAREVERLDDPPALDAVLVVDDAELDKLLEVVPEVVQRERERRGEAGVVDAACATRGCFATIGGGF